MTEQLFMTAGQAAQRLGIRRATLYAYVSRGLIRSQPVGDGSRRHHYLAADVQALHLRREQQRSPAKVAESVLDWGVPVLESSITLIEDGRLYYRGQDALALAVEATLEEVAALLWSGELNGRRFEYSTAQEVPEWGEKDHFSALARFQFALLQAATHDPAAYDLRPESLINSGMRIMCLLTRVLSPVCPSSAGIAGALQEGWDLAVEARLLLNAALILCADHELNVSTFTTRCIASAGSTPYAVVQGGLAALQGTRHGGHTARVEALLREVGQAEDAQAVLAARLRRGEPLPGFGHPLYPDGDPRARLLLELVESHSPPSHAQELALSVTAAAEHLLGVQPTIDFALVAMALALALPPGSALAIFALGRTVGWLAHALEQYTAGTLIRPRARYGGERPEIHR